MASETVRVQSDSYDQLRALAHDEGVSMTDVLAKAIEAYARRRFIEEANHDYERLRKDRRAWADELAERKVWDATLADDLKDD